MRYILLILLAALSSSCGKTENQPSCKSQESCIAEPNCECWCSVKCGYRKKNATDHPVYIENDPNGKQCYCKQWDLDHYKENCKEGKKVKEPANAK